MMYSYNPVNLIYYIIFITKLLRNRDTVIDTNYKT